MPHATRVSLVPDSTLDSPTFKYEGTIYYRIDDDHSILSNIFDVAFTMMLYSIADRGVLIVYKLP